MDWQPIETAPKDGTTIILGSEPLQRVSAGYWDAPEHGRYLGDCGGACRCPEYDDPPEPYWASEDGGFFAEGPYAPTHWMPYPKPPNHRR